MSKEHICETCRFRSKDNPSLCLAEACYFGDMWEPEDQNASDEHIPSVFSEGDCEAIYNDFMKSAEN